MWGLYSHSRYPKDPNVLKIVWVLNSVLILILLCHSNLVHFWGCGAIVNQYRGPGWTILIQYGSSSKSVLLAVGIDDAVLELSTKDMHTYIHVSHT